MAEGVGWRWIVRAALLVVSSMACACTDHDRLDPQRVAGPQLDDDAWRYPGLSVSEPPPPPPMLPDVELDPTTAPGTIVEFTYEESDEMLVVRRDGELMSFSVHQLPAWQPAWTLTVHRSQGSEYKHVLLVLPPDESPVVTRELIYTGITRASEHCTLVATRLRLLQDIEVRMKRHSGLAERIGW